MTTQSASTISVAPSPSNSMQAFPNWDKAEIQKRLDENTSLLNEWSVLLDRTENLPSEKITPQDIIDHNRLRRRLHENLGSMAKMVQQQLRPNKRPADTLSTGGNASNTTQQPSQQTVDLTDSSPSPQNG